MNQYTSTVASLVLTVLLTVGCTHLIFADKGFLPWRSDEEISIAGTRRSLATTTTTPVPDAVPVHDANPAASEWVSVPISTTPAPPRGPAPAPHTLPAVTTVTNHSHAESGFGNGGV